MPRRIQSDAPENVDSLDTIPGSTRSRAAVRDFSLSMAAFSAVMVIAFRYFPLYDKSVVWMYDGIDQHYPSLYYLNLWIRNFLHNPLDGLPLWSHTIGLGGDIISSFSFYGLGDPFVLLSLAFPMAQMELAYTLMFYARVLCAGAFSLLYLRTMGLRRMPALTATLVYVFSGYLLCNGTRHPFFVNAVLFLPLLLLSTEYLLKGRKHWLITVTVMLTALSNFYLFYILTLVTVIYAVARYFEITPREDRWRRLPVVGGGFAALYTLGVALAAPILIPTVIAITHTARSQTAYSLSLFYSLEEYRNIVIDLMASSTHAHFSFMGFSVLGFVLAPVLFVRRGSYRALKVILVAYCAFIALPVFGSLFNGLTFPLSRFAFSWGIFLALAVGLLLSDERSFGRRDVFAMAAGYSVYVVLVLVFCFPVSPALIVPSVFGGLTIAVCAFESGQRRATRTPVGASAFVETWRSHPTRWALLALVVLNIVANSAILNDASYLSWPSEFVDRGLVNKAYRSNTGHLIGKLPKDHFFRIDDRDSQGSNAALVLKRQSTSVYLSILDGGISTFRSELGVATNRLPSISLDGFDDRAIPQALLGVEYYLALRDQTRFVPFGYQRYDQNRTALAYHNKNALPLGFVFENAISRAEYLKLSAIDKQSALLQGAVIEDGDLPHIPRIRAVSEAVELTCTVESAKGPKTDRNDNEITANAPVTEMVLGFNPVPNSELYIQREGLDENAPPSTSEPKVTPYGAVSQMDLVRQARANAFYKEPWYLFTKYSAGKRTKTHLWHTEAIPYHWGQDTDLVSMGYWSKGKDRVKVSTSPPGFLSPDKLKVYALPMNGFEARIAQLRQGAMTRVTTKGDTMTGTVSSAGGLLFLSIPYSSGWSATVDGAPTPIVRTHTAFSGVPVAKGTHSIVLHYRTPGLNAGLLISAFSAIVLGLLVGLARRRGRTA